jgi:endonuclease-3
MTVDLLAEAYPDAVCELEYRSPWELLVATVLSAQCTDQRVNRVTPQLFERWPGPADLAEAELEDLEDVIRTTGLHRSKARNLRRTARLIVAEHGSAVPPDLDALVRLPGVGRKTAKVVLGEAFGLAAGVAVDTHVKRLAGRIGLSSSDDPERVARDLEALVPKRDWIDLSKRLVLHGRRVCSARRPSCDGCPLVGVCARIGV